VTTGLSSNFSIRFVVESDTEALLELLFEQDLHDGGDRSEQLSAEALRRNLFSEAPVAEGFLAERDGVLLGLAAFRNSATTFGIRPEIYLDDLYVRSVARRCGIARGLLAKLADVARERGAWRIRLDVAEANSAAIALYRSCGGTLFDTFRGCEIAVR
jgi:ribosomal protein S18 acetylase RimI-like enzyme